MWDGWEQKYGGTRHDRAILNNYHRAFNKRSVRNWGTKAEPGATLGLEPEQGAKCVGCAFEFPDDQSILDCLRKREGHSFSFNKLDVTLEDGRIVQAVTPVNDRSANTYIGNFCLKKRAEMARVAIGSDGKCIDYVTNIRDKLKEMGISDPYVEELWEAICSLAINRRRRP
jgi:cation transport protein ChaC